MPILPDPVITTVQDVKEIYARRAPRMFYDYTESGSWSEQTFRENVTDYDQIRLRQRVAVDRRADGSACAFYGRRVFFPQR